MEETKHADPLKDLKKRTGSVDVYKKLGASRDLWDKLHVEYYLNPDLNMEDDARRTAALNGQDQDAIVKVNTEYAVAIIAAWDLLDEDGQPIEFERRDGTHAGALQHPHRFCLTAIGKEEGKLCTLKKR